MRASLCDSARPVALLTAGHCLAKRPSHTGPTNLDFVGSPPQSLLLRWVNEKAQKSGKQKNHGLLSLRPGEVHESVQCAAHPSLGTNLSTSNVSLTALTRQEETPTTLAQRTANKAASRRLDWHAHKDRWSPMMSL